MQGDSKVNIQIFKQGKKHKNKTESHRLKILNLMNKKIGKKMEK